MGSSGSGRGLKPAELLGIAFGGGGGSGGGTTSVCGAENRQSSLRPRQVSEDNELGGALGLGAGSHAFGHQHLEVSTFVS